MKQILGGSMLVIATVLLVIAVYSNIRTQKVPDNMYVLVTLYTLILGLDLLKDGK
jgi:hypothetical protein